MEEPPRLFLHPDGIARPFPPDSPTTPRPTPSPIRPPSRPRSPLSTPPRRRAWRRILMTTFIVLIALLVIGGINDAHDPEYADVNPKTLPPCEYARNRHMTLSELGKLRVTARSAMVQFAIQARPDCWSGWVVLPKEMVTIESGRYGWQLWPPARGGQEFDFEFGDGTLRTGGSGDGWFITNGTQKFRIRSRKKPGPAIFIVGFFKDL